MTARVEQGPIHVYAYRRSAEGIYRPAADSADVLELDEPFAIKLPIAEITPRGRRPLRVSICLRRGAGILAYGSMEPSRPLSPPLGLRLIVGLRVIVLTTTGSLVLLLGVLWLLGHGFTRPATVWMALPLILGGADLVLVPAVGSTVRPLPYGIEAPAARRVSARVLRTVTYLRLALAEAPALFGLVASVIASSMVPYTIGLAFAVPLLLVMAYPSKRVVDDVGSRLESAGVPSQLWEGLGSSHR